MDRVEKEIKEGYEQSEKNWSFMKEFFTLFMNEPSIREKLSEKTKKYADMGKIKAGLLCAMDFHRLYEELSYKNRDNCPEACNTSAPYYMGGEVLVYRCFDYDTARFEK